MVSNGQHSDGEMGLNFEQVAITKVVRRMRGGAQSQLVQGVNGRYYVAKFVGNPQGTRTLVNEMVAAYFFERMGLSTPALRILHLPPDQSLRAGLTFQIGNQNVPVEGSLHLGSECPVDPIDTMILDLLPAGLYSKVSNLSDFGAAFLLDKWLTQTDARQAIFIRDRSVKHKLMFRAYLIDHGMSFMGSTWKFTETHLHGLFVDRRIYSYFDLRAACESALLTVESLTTSEVLNAGNGIPQQWLQNGDDKQLQCVLLALDRRRDFLRATVLHALTFYKNLFSTTMAAQ